ncbi:uncharacterized protein LOC141849386 [Brevipalpus obovatus]|uniref:uncharacterized protein LOC141849386 n=1 Tax=Brevipalpus obovatus TaxID=246614 RepID=UPI003D9E5277
MQSTKGTLIQRSRPSPLIANGKGIPKSIDIKRNIPSSNKPSSRCPPSSFQSNSLRNTASQRPSSRESNRPAHRSGPIKEETTAARQIPKPQMNFNNHKSQPSTTAKKTNAADDDAPSNKTVITKLNGISGDSRGFDKSVPPPRKIGTASDRKVSTVSHVTNGFAVNTNSVRKAATPGTASARAATTLISFQRDIDRYKKLSEYQKRDLIAAKSEMSRTHLLVEGLLVVVKYLTEHMKAFANPSLNSEIKRQNLNIDKLKEECRSLESVIERLRSNQFKREDQLKEEVERLCLEIANEKKRHDKEKSQLFDMFEDQMRDQKKNFEKDMKKAEEERLKLEQDKEQLKEEVSIRLQEIQRLTERVRNLEDSLSMEKDRRCRMLQERVQFMTNEIQSLKDVLELKDSELRSLKNRIQTEELKAQDLETCQLTIANLTQRLEALEAAASQKNAIITALKQENESLKDRYDREQRERRRISMKNEELEFTLSEIVTPCKNQLANSSCQVDDTFVTPFKSAPRTRLTMTSVHAAPKPIPSWTSRKPRTSMVARKDLRNSLNSDVNIPLLQPLEQSPPLPPTSEQASSSSSSCSIPTDAQSKSSQATLTFHESEMNNQKCNENKRNFDPLKPLSMNLPQSIMDSGFEDIEGIK